ncbi:MAG: phosphotransferase [Bdellovibrionota bacterium]|jgi:aminoglycoside/choline kinase family phosphotransferase
MKIDDELYGLTRDLLNSNVTTSTARISKITPLTGDASGRRYLRVLLTDSKIASVILMLTTEIKGPVVCSETPIDPNLAFIELSPFLNSHGYRVPKIFAVSADRHALLVEDAGDLPLWHFTFNKLSTTENNDSKKSSPLFTFELYKKAVNAILTLQKIPTTADSIACKRSLEFDQYQIESRRFIEHYLKPNRYPPSMIASLEPLLDELCAGVAAHPRTLVHRDFMPWNIHLSQKNEIITIDYQDMLVGSAAYDIVSLIHDRDADQALGDDLCTQIANYFFDNTTLLQDRRSYHEALIQRYLRLAGQFNLLSEKVQNPIYRSWIPGCLKRIGRSLPLVPHFAPLAEVLSAIPEIEKGLSSPWHF